MPKGMTMRESMILGTAGAGFTSLQRMEENGLSPDKGTPFPNLPERWAGVVDPVAGKSLMYIIHTMQYGGLIAVSAPLW